MGSTTPSNLRALGLKIGNKLVRDYLEALLSDGGEELLSAQAYMLGALHTHLEEHPATDGQVGEYYKLLGLTPAEVRMISSTPYKN